MCVLSEKRKDSKGRILKEGESQRKNGTYDYRYINVHKKRCCIYAKTLKELREKESQIQKDLADGIDYAAGEITVSELVDRYFDSRRGLKQNSIRAYKTAIKKIKSHEFGSYKIRNVKISDAKLFFTSLHDSGMMKNTIGVVYAVIRPAFEMAVDDDIIRKNPFKFKLSDIIINDAPGRNALTKEQQNQYLSFIREHGNIGYYNEIVILLGTGLRVSELYGLTMQDIDFENNKINITKQLCRTAYKPYFITEPKTKSGIRSIPMTDNVYMAFKRVLNDRPHLDQEPVIDGYSEFVFLDKNNEPKVGMHLQNYMRSIQKTCRELFGNDFPTITPHVLRHTFCTNVQQAGIDVKSLQYLMGHSNASVTLDVYTHNNYKSAEEAFNKIASNL